ncbi:uncharacterized protein LOC112601212 [Melanaphis sacchari]|uniref:uncharacterized protein LOC112601212 n=1 Tax=Melanaphis sacchari TaxID=742174 RepID=UPI000DC14F63|nr:uncharacterized protein LOC112601212 [Melanaphis sacchari]
MTVFKITLRPILIFSQFLGLISISYTLEPTTGLSLRNFLEFLPVESDFLDEWSHSEIAISLEKIRILHSELSELLKTFSLGYGPLLLSFFTFNFINLLVQFFFSICINVTKSLTPNVLPIIMILRYAIPHVLNFQILIFTMSIIIVVSLIHDKVKMFMLQLSFFELDEISSYGIFNINLNIVMSIIVLLITGLITLIQMKNHAIIISMINGTLTFADGMYTI